MLICIYYSPIISCYPDFVSLLLLFSGHKVRERLQPSVPGHHHLSPYVRQPLMMPTSEFMQASSLASVQSSLSSSSSSLGSGGGETPQMQRVSFAHREGSAFSAIPSGRKFKIGISDFLYF